MDYKKTLHMAAFLLLVVGGLNWLLYAFGYNLVTLVFGSVPTLEMLVYVLVGLSALYLAVTHMGDCKVCSKK